MAGAALDVSVLGVAWVLLALFESVGVVVLTAVSPPMLLEPCVELEPPRKSVTYQPEPFS